MLPQLLSHFDNMFWILCNIGKIKISSVTVSSGTINGISDFKIFVRCSSWNQVFVCVVVVFQFVIFLYFLARFFNGRARKLCLSKYSLKLLALIFEPVKPNPSPKCMFELSSSRVICSSTSVQISSKYIFSVEFFMLPKIMEHLDHLCTCRHTGGNRNVMITFSFRG